MKSTSSNQGGSSPRSLLEAFFPICRVQPESGLICRLHECENRRISLLNLDQIAEAAVLPLLSEAEHNYLHRFRYPKRRQEWLGGRIAAKAALSDALDASALRGLSILPDQHGRPRVSGQADPRLSLSISHSGGYAAALAVRGPRCGLDIQEVSAKLLGLTKYFALPAELDLLPDQSELALTMLWSVKEAMKKSLLSAQPAIFSGIEMKQCRKHAPDLWQFCCAVQGHPLQTASVHACPPYVLALTRG